MESTDLEMRHRSEENRAHYKVGQGEKSYSISSYSFVEDAPTSESPIGRILFVSNGTVRNLSIFIQDMIGDGFIQFIVTKSSPDEIVDIHQYKLKKGSNSFEGFTIEKGSRMAIRLHGKGEYEVMGIWIGFNFKHVGGKNG